MSKDTRCALTSERSVHIHHVGMTWPDADTCANPRNIVELQYVMMDYTLKCCAC